MLSNTLVLAAQEETLAAGYDKKSSKTDPSLLV